MERKLKRFLLSVPIYLILISLLIACSSSQNTTVTEKPFDPTPQTNIQDIGTFPPISDSTSDDIQFISYPTTVGRNETASVKIKGKPNTVYSITVYYPSGPSKASGLNDKQSDENGYVSWSWKIGGRTSKGSHEIVVEGGGDTQSISFNVK